MTTTKRAMAGKAKGKKGEATETRSNIAEDALARVLDGLETTEEKLAALSSKFIEQHQDLRKASRGRDEAEGKVGMALVERDAARQELAKNVEMNEKLQKLCRTLQDANKETSALLREREDTQIKLREELQAKFDEGLGAVSARIEESASVRDDLIKENDTLRDHLKKLVARGDLQEETYNKARDAFDLEKQLLEARLAEAAAVNENLVARLDKREEESKGYLDQLTSYADKFGDFQGVISQSNEHFTQFKKEIADLSKKLIASEQAQREMEKKTLKSDVAMIKLLEEREALTMQCGGLKAQKDKLEGLCRALQKQSIGDKENNAKPPEQTAVV